MGDLPRGPALVLDTSVWINLIATGHLERILSGLACSCIAPELVIGEIKRHPVSGAPFPIDSHPLSSLSPVVSIVSLEPAELRVFLDIVGAPATSALGDGEAAAIAIAASRGFPLVLDDRKARRIVRERFSEIQMYWTVDILRAGRLRTALGAALADECWAKAKEFGRMHIPR